MLRTHASAALMAAAAMTALTGCYSFYPQGGHPGMHSPSSGPVFPTQAVPQSSFVMPDDAAGSPSGVTQTFAPSGKLEAPNPQAAPGASAESPVPEPRDPGSDTAEGDLDADRTTQKVLPSDPEGVSLAEPERLNFQPPRVIASADPDQKIPGVVGVSLEESLNENASTGMARDSKYRWLQGLVEYDPQYRSWHMTQP